MAEDEKRAQQASLDRATADAARLTRKLAETEASLNAAQGRLRHVEANFVEASTERSRLVSALDEANERHAHEQSVSQNDRASTRCRRAQPRSTEGRCWSKPANTCSLAPRTSATTTAAPPRSLWNVMPCSRAWRIWKPTASPARSQLKEIGQSRIRLL